MTAANLHNEKGDCGIEEIVMRCKVGETKDQHLEY